MPLLNPGRMDRKVTILQSTATKDSEGGPVLNWSAFASNIWAKREDLPARELWQARQVTTKVLRRYRIWHLAGVTEAMRLIDEGRTFDIKSIGDPDGYRREMVLLCEEVT